MHAKIPARVLLCAAFGLMFPIHLEAGDKKKPAEAAKSSPEKKPHPKKARPERKETGRGISQEQLKKLEEQLAANRRDLEKIRDSFHLAQKELAAKAQQIESLESKNRSHENAAKKTGEELRTAQEELKKAAGQLARTQDELKKANEEMRHFQANDFKKAAQSLEAEKKKSASLESYLKDTQREREEAERKLAEIAAVLAKRSAPPKSKSPAPTKKLEPKKPASKSRQPAQSQPKPITIAPIQYQLNWAVNYQERDRVLNQLRAVLKKHPRAKIQIIGYADDTRYQDVNELVGGNRAKFLAAYLRNNGLPEKQITWRGIGSPKQGSGNGNRKAVIQIEN